MYDIPFDRSFLQLSNGIRHGMPSTDPKSELTAKASMAQPVSQSAVYANGLTAGDHALQVINQCVIIKLTSKLKYTATNIFNLLCMERKA
jgi:hypothetical protein